MWSAANRIVGALSDVTVGTVIVIVHVAMADRDLERKQRQRREARLARSRT